MRAAGFEPAHLSITALETDPLDHSGMHACTTGSFDISCTDENLLDLKNSGVLYFSPKRSKTSVAVERPQGYEHVGPHFISFLISIFCVLQSTPK